LNTANKFFETPMGVLLNLYEHEKNQFPIAAKPHNLPSDLIISLTSHQLRFKWLHLTIESLLEQTIIADQIILWIAEGEMEELPQSVISLSEKIEIKGTKDLKSFKKIIPSILAFPNAYIVICDDDIYYPRLWLQNLIDGAQLNPNMIAAGAVHRFHATSEQQLAPYCDWSFDVQDNLARLPSQDILPIGVGGVLYPPNSLHEDTTRIELIQELCPRGDDLWLYAMSKMRNYLPIKVGKKLHPIFWPGTQNNGLFIENMFQHDDIAIHKLTQRYGPAIFQTPAINLLKPTL
jgi:hypothetical protein